MRILFLFIGMSSFLATIAQVQEPNFDNLIKYVKANKKSIYNTQFGITPLVSEYAGKSPTHQISSISNLMGEYLNAENTGNQNQKNIIFYKIYNYLFNGKGLPYISLNAIGIDDDEYPIAFSNWEYKYLRDIGLFVAFNKYNDGYSIIVFDPIFGPLYFQKNSSGFKFNENQSYALDIFFPNGGEIYEYRPPTNYYEKRKKYYIKNLEGSWSIVGPNININYDGSARISEARYLPQFGHDEIKPIKIKDNRYYIASDDLRESYVGNFKYYPSQYQKTLMAQAGQITVSQAADPNFYILNEKEGTRYSGVKNVTILSRSGFPIIPNYNEIVQVNDNFFITKLNNKYGLIYLTPETIKSNKFVLLENVYETLSVFPSSPNAPFFKVGLNIGELTTDYSYNENGILNKNKSNQDSSNFIIGNSIKIASKEVRRSPELKKDYANVFYDTNYTLFDLFSDEPIFPDESGKYDIIISSNENKSPQKFTGTGLELSKRRMFKFKSLETHRKWAQGDVAPKTVN